MRMREIMALIEGAVSQTTIRSYHWDATVRESVLAEGRDAPLYHFTDEAGLQAILDSDILGQAAQGSSVSLTRNQNIPFHARMYAVLVLDQAKLAQRYRFQTMYGDRREEFQVQIRQPESEERIQGRIRDLHQYLKAIVVSNETLAVIREIEQIWEIEPAYRSSWQNHAWKQGTLARAIVSYRNRFGVPFQARDRQDRMWAGRAKAQQARKPSRRPPAGA